jgi:hypothetical protein
VEVAGNLNAMAAMRERIAASSGDNTNEVALVARALNSTILEGDNVQKDLGDTPHMDLRDTTHIDVADGGGVVKSTDTQECTTSNVDNDVSIEENENEYVIEISI